MIYLNFHTIIKSSKISISDLLLSLKSSSFLVIFLEGYISFSYLISFTKCVHIRPQNFLSPPNWLYVYKSVFLPCIEFCISYLGRLHSDGFSRKCEVYDFSGNINYFNLSYTLQSPSISLINVSLFFLYHNYMTAFMNTIVKYLFWW